MRAPGAHYVQRCAQKHDRNADEGDEYKNFLEGRLEFEHELVAAFAGRGVLEEHHVDEVD